MAVMAICWVKMIRELRSSGIQIFATPETVMKREKRSAGSWIRKNAEVEKRVWSSSSRKRGNLVAAAAATTIINKTARFSSWHLRCVRFNTASFTFPRLPFVFSLFIPFFSPLFSFQFVSRFLSSFSSLFFHRASFSSSLSFATLIAVDIKQIWDKSIVLWRGIVPTRRMKAERTELFRNFKCTISKGGGELVVAW